MKSIGIRSSIITTFQGSDVVIPNGDLLNQHLTNWTLGSSRCRSEIKVGVAYGSDLEEVQALILDVLKNHPSVMVKPEPAIWVTLFSDSSVDFSINYLGGSFYDD
ncbi:MAG: mechanosensitive ion channel [Flavobacteriaceae bacterium]|nr:mechanosensitive ion channel [Flavobacteriaceae bacterium]